MSPAKMPSILVSGQCTLHWGRMEFGNIGNYYIAEPFFGELRNMFPEAIIRTTLQMSEPFCRRHGVEVLPMDLYYAWSEDDLPRAQLELKWARAFADSGALPGRSPYMEEILASDLVVNLSGDLWGDNADLAGKDRFVVGLCKDRTAQLLGKPVVMLTGSPGPFDTTTVIGFAREVFANYALVTNREPLSASILEANGFDLTSVRTRACPAFLFGSSVGGADQLNLPRISSRSAERPVMGFVLCGWNFSEGPFDRWPRDDKEYDTFATAIELMDSEFGASIRLLSHANGFPPHPAPFKLLHGRDYPIIKQLEAIVKNRGAARDVVALDGVYSACETWATIGSLSMLVSGRVHAAVAGLSQSIPTVIIDYGHDPRAHKLRGLASLAGIEDYVADPATPGDLAAKIHSCWENRRQLRDHLDRRVPELKELARRSFSELKYILAGQSLPEENA